MSIHHYVPLLKNKLHPQTYLLLIEGDQRPSTTSCVGTWTVAATDDVAAADRHRHRLIPTYRLFPDRH